MTKSPFWMAPMLGCVATAVLALANVAQAACNANMAQSRPDGRYEAVAGATPSGSEVRDKVTGLVWQRCVLGMAWNGSTCTGTASNLSWQNALDAARTASASTAAAATPWRVPSHAELFSLSELTCYNPAINTTWFPNTPTDWAWSSSPYAGSRDDAWVVSFGDGSDNYYYKGSTNRVRLVRSGL